jgi:hypothetical protein
MGRAKYSRRAGNHGLGPSGGARVRCRSPAEARIQVRQSMFNETARRTPRQLRRALRAGRISRPSSADRQRSPHQTAQNPRSSCYSHHGGALRHRAEPSQAPAPVRGRGQGGGGRRPHFAGGDQADSCGATDTPEPSGAHFQASQLEARGTAAGVPLTGWGVARAARHRALRDPSPPGPARGKRRQDLTSPLADRAPPPDVAGGQRPAVSTPHPTSRTTRTRRRSSR